MAVRESPHAHGTVGPDAVGRRIVELAPEDPRWQSYVSRSADALPYHYPAWSAVLHETFGFRPATLGCTDPAGQVTGILPLVEKRSLLTGLHLTSLPCSPSAGPVADDLASTRALLASAAARVDGSAARWLQVKVMSSALRSPVDGFSHVVWDPTYVLDLPADPAQLRFRNPRNHAAVMRLIRQADRQDVIVREASSLRDVRRWYGLYLETVRAHGVPPRPFRLFEAMWQMLAPEDRRLLLAEKHIGGKTVLLGGCFYLCAGQTMVFAFNGRDRTKPHLRANEALHWRAITDACAAGFGRYDFGEPCNSGLQRFKEKWGTRPVGIYRYQYPRRRELERGALGPGSLRNTAERAWRHVPLPVTSRLGGWIYRHL